MGINQFRRDPVTGEWSIIISESKETNVRELFLQNQSRSVGTVKNAKHSCQFCSGHEAETASEIFSVREDGTNKDEDGWSVRVIPNKEPFLQIFGDLNNRGLGLYDVLDGIGAHELVIESPNHGEQIPDMSLQQIEDVLTAYRERILDLKKDTRFRYVLLHKNYGEGTKEVSRHSYTHIIATPITPTRVKMELVNALEHYRYKERCIFCDIINQELADDKRVVLQNDKFLAMTPFASRAPFSVWILPKEHETFFEWNSEPNQLASILQNFLRKIKITLADPNFVMVVHSGPNIGTAKHRDYWETLEKDYHWHIEITPRFRGYTSFETGSGFHVNVLSPERATEILKNEKID